MTCSWIEGKCQEPVKYVASWNGFHIMVCVKHVDATIRWALGLHPSKLQPPSRTDAVRVTVVEKWKDDSARETLQEQLDRLSLLMRRRVDSLEGRVAHLEGLPVAQRLRELDARVHQLEAHPAGCSCTRCTG